MSKSDLSLRAAPAKPKLWPYALWGTVSLLLADFVWPSALAGAIVVVAGFDKHLKYKKRKAEADRSLSEANAMFETVAALELTPRLKLLGQ
ncbi:hypothetical protein AWB75_00546 [Caballeronia catudaia]|uniref:Uncharacterized protein n=1 Tax=Caballeronia catudaia TaxID=1777136 RepID=A0A157ZCX6_9BURK|nr:hypothetical protein [Caballeronia catudaia]SAK43386.1 hypothetical protein AWB75_00546 [Caballeronia catudaia]